MPSEKNSAPKPLKQLTDVDVDEVSLVDLPANLEPFAVVKRQEGGETMSKPNEEAVTPPEETKPVEKAAEAHAALVKEKMEAIMKLAGGLGEASDAKDLRAKLRQMQDLAWSISPDAEVVQALSKSLPTAIEKAEEYGYGMPDDAKKAKGDLIKALQDLVKSCNSMLEKLQKAAQGGKDDKDYPQPGKETKADEKKPEDDKMKADKPKEYYPKKSVLLTVKDDEVVFDGDVEILKGKRFTSTRKETLKNVLSLVLGMAKELDPDMLPGVLKDLGLAEVTDKAAMPPEEDEKKKPEKKATKKSQDNELEDLRKRVAELESAKGDSNAEPTDDTAKPVEKNRGFWEGVL